MQIPLGDLAGLSNLHTLCPTYIVHLPSRTHAHAGRPTYIALVHTPSRTHAHAGRPTYIALVHTPSCMHVHAVPRTRALACTHAHAHTLTHTKMQSLCRPPESAVADEIKWEQTEAGGSGPRLCASQPASQSSGATDAILFPASL